MPPHRKKPSESAACPPFFPSTLSSIVPSLLKHMCLFRPCHRWMFGQWCRVCGRKAPVPPVWPHPSVDIHCWKPSAHAGYTWHLYIKLWLPSWVASKTMVVPSVWTSGNHKVLVSSAGIPQWNVQWPRLGLHVITEKSMWVSHPCDHLSVFHPQIICWEVLTLVAFSRLLTRKYELWLTRWIQLWMIRSLPCYYQ